MVIGNMYSYSSQMNDSKIWCIGFAGKFALSIAWATKKGDWWTTEKRKTGFIWMNRNNKRITLFIGRVGLSIHRKKEVKA